MNVERFSGSEESDGLHVAVPIKASFRGVTGVTYTVDEALGVLGWGSIQWKVIAFSALVWAFTGIAAVWLPMFSTFSRCSFDVKSWQVMLIGTAFFIGRPITSTVMGMMSDRFGRKLTLLMAAVYSFYFHFLASVAPSLPWMIFLVFMIGCSIGSMIGVSLAYIGELQPPNYRKVIGAAMQAAAFGGGVLAILLALGAYELGWSWRIGCALGSLLVIPMLALYKCVPESPHYYVSRLKLDQAEEVLQEIADCNGTELPPGRLVQCESIAKELTQRRGEKGLWYMLICPPKVFILLIGVCIVQTLSSYVYNSFFYLASSLTIATSHGAHKCPPYNTIDYINMIWSMSAELPACALAGLSVRWMRQRLVFLSLGSGLILSFGVLLLRKLTQTEVMACFFVSRAFGSALVHAQYAYLPEFFASVVRGKALGVVHTVLNLGPVVVPYTAGVLLLEHVFTGKLVFLMISVIFTVGCILLPDVSSKPLEDSVFSA